MLKSLIFSLHDRREVGKSVHKLEGCPIHPNRNRSSKWCRSVTDRDGSSLCFSLVTVCQFGTDLENIRGCVMVCGENVGGSSWSGRIATTRHYLDGWWRLVTVCQFAMDLENIDYGVMVCGGNVGGSSRSGRIATTRHYHDGWWRLVTVCQFCIDLENIYGGVMEGVKMLAGRPDRDGSCWPVTTVMDGDILWPFVNSREIHVTFMAVLLRGVELLGDLTYN